MIRILTVLCLLASFPLPARGGARVWRHTDGRTVTGEYQWANQETLFLKKPDGKELQIALGSLSNADLEYVRGILGKLRAVGIFFQAPLVWEEYRSKNFTAQEAARAGYYPIDSRVASAGTLRVEFRRFGDPPALDADQKVVLRLSTAPRPDAGTSSQIRVIHEGKVVGGTRATVARGSTVDIALPLAVLKGGNRIVLEVNCGTDPVLVRTGSSGAGPRLLIVKSKPR